MRNMLRIKELKNNFYYIVLMKRCWKNPPKIKIYEALGCLADNRLVTTESGATVWSSSRNQSYIVKFDQTSGAIMANDNGSYWQDYLGYPAIAYLINCGMLPYNKKFAAALRSIPWKSVNQINNNDFEKSLAQIHQALTSSGFDVSALIEHIDLVSKQIEKLNVKKLGEKIEPPTEKSTK